MICLQTALIGALLAAAKSPGAQVMEVKTDLSLWTGVIFLLLLAILWRFAWRPIAAALDKREQNVADQIAQAEAARQKAQEVLASYEEKLAAAEQRVKAIIDQGRRDAERVGQQLLDKAKQQGEAEYQQALARIETATAEAIKELAAKSSDMAIELASKIVRKELTARDHAQLIEQAVAGFAQSSGDRNKVSRN